MIYWGGGVVVWFLCISNNFLTNTLYFTVSFSTLIKGGTIVSAILKCLWKLILHFYVSKCVYAS